MSPNLLSLLLVTPSLLKSTCSDLHHFASKVLVPAVLPPALGVGHACRSPPLQTDWWPAHIWHSLPAGAHSRSALPLSLHLSRPFPLHMGSPHAHRPSAMSWAQHPGLSTDTTITLQDELPDVPQIHAKYCIPEFSLSFHITVFLKKWSQMVSVVCVICLRSESATDAVEEAGQHGWPHRWRIGFLIELREFHGGQPNPRPAADFILHGWWIIITPNKPNKAL